jgi:hypothetical protein
MNVLKVYKGVKICVSEQGEFFCDVKKNSENFKDNTFKSLKLTSIESAIDQFKGEPEEQPTSYYLIEVWQLIFQKITSTKHIGSRVFFDDGTDSSRHDRKQLYPENIDQTEEFKNLRDILTQMDRNQKEAQRLYDLNKDLRSLADTILRQFKKVNIS